MNRVQTNAQRAVLSAWLLLLVLVTARQLHTPFEMRQLGWALAYALPLLICVPGLWRGSRYTHKWATLCVLPYFVVGITEGVANPVLRSWALSMLGLSLLWFFALVMYLRVSREP
jgi:uncharacterized membrane protein